MPPAADFAITCGMPSWPLEHRTRILEYCVSSAFRPLTSRLLRGPGWCTHADEVSARCPVPTAGIFLMHYKSLLTNHRRAGNHHASLDWGVYFWGFFANEKRVNVIAHPIRLRVKGYRLDDIARHTSDLKLVRRAA